MARDYRKQPVIFEVMGRGDFPRDMLRYDSCWPVTGQDCDKLYCGPTLEDMKEIRTIRFASFSPSAPTHGRWSSFLWGCKVIDDE